MVSCSGLPGVVVEEINVVVVIGISVVLGGTTVVVVIGISVVVVGGKDVEGTSGKSVVVLC